MGFEKEKKSVPRAERKAKKRKAEDAIPDVPEDYAEEVEEPVKSKKRKASNDEEPKAEKKSKKEKKSKDTKADDEDVVMDEVVPAKDDKDGEDEEAQDPDAPRLSKKERKALRKAKEAAERLANPPVEGEALVEKSSAPKTDAKKPAAKAAPTPRSAKPIPLDENGNPVKKKNNRNREKKRLAAAALAASGEKAPPRFIVFVGNLPFNATKETVEKHFGSVHPKSVRYLTDKVTKKGKGAAFVEFEGYDHMKTALRTMHHTEFDAGDGREKRKINVELTAGGGGNTKERKAKIVEKNEKLSEQRTRKIGEEEKQKLEKKTGVKVDTVPGAKASKEDKEGIHPSRRARVA